MFVSQSDNQRSDFDTNAAREVFKRSACDRCRGQKLRCIRNNINQASCDRCHRAKAVCITTPTLRMGRPARAEAARLRETITKRQGTVSSLSSTPASSTQNPPPLPATRNIEHGILDTGEVHQSNSLGEADCISTLYHGTLDLDVPVFEEDEFSPIGSSSSFDDPHDFSSSQYHVNLPQFDLPQACQAPGNMWHASQDTNARELEANFEELADGSPMALTSTKSPSDSDTSSLRKLSDEYQGSVEQLSKLSMEIYRQLRLTGTTVDLAVASDLSSSDQNESEPQHPIAMMIHGLQRFQELLREIPSSHSRLCAATSRNIAPVSLEAILSPAETPSQHKRSSAAYITTSPTESRSSDLSLSPSVSKCQSYSKPLSSEALPVSQNNVRQAQIHGLDLPTSLLTITCYINLVRLCRNVFSNIRFCLLTLDHQAVFATLSDLQISGVSLQQDGNLQILVLVQVAISLLDRIGSSLCLPNGASIDGAQRNEEPVWNKIIPPKLMEVVLREEELDGQDLYSGGIKAFREEIRKLRRVLNKM